MSHVPFVVMIIRSFPPSSLITGFVTRVTRRVPHVEQEVLTLPEHLSSSQVLVGFVLPRSLAWCVVFWISLFVLLFVFFWSLCSLYFFHFRLLIIPLVS